MLKVKNLSNATNNRVAVWIGPHFNSKGGVASVIKIYKEEGFFNNGDNRFIPTMEDGSKFNKLLIFFKALYLFMFYIKRMKLVHVHLSCKASFWRKSIFILLASYFRVPVIIHLHDSGFPIYHTLSPALKMWFINMILSKSKHIFVLSYEIRDYLKRLPCDLNPRVFPNPIVIKSSKLIYQKKVNTLLFLGRIVKEKGIQELIEAFYKVKKQLPFTKLIIGGDGDMSLISNLLKKYDLQNNVTLKGWVNEKERTALVRSCTMLVLPSYGEGQSMSILEAMESYLPVISTNVGGTTFLIDNGINGLLVPPKDSAALASAIILLMQNPDFMEQIAIEARKKVEELFDSKKIINTVQKLYNSY